MRVDGHSHLLGFLASALALQAVGALLGCLLLLTGRRGCGSDGRWRGCGHRCRRSDGGRGPLGGDLGGRLGSRRSRLDGRMGSHRSRLRGGGGNRLALLRLTLLLLIGNRRCRDRHRRRRSSSSGGSLVATTHAHRQKHDGQCDQYTRSKRDQCFGVHD